MNHDHFSIAWSALEYFIDLILNSTKLPTPRMINIHNTSQEMSTKLLGSYIPVPTLKQKAKFTERKAQRKLLPAVCTTTNITWPTLTVYLFHFHIFYFSENRGILSVVSRFPQYPAWFNKIIWRLRHSILEEMKLIWSIFGYLYQPTVNLCSHRKRQSGASLC